MKALLVNPPFQRLKGVQYNDFHLGLTLLTSLAREAGFDASMLDLEMGRPEKGCFSYRRLFDAYDNYLAALKCDDAEPWIELKTALRQLSPRVVGVTASAPVWPSARKVLSLTKQADPSIITVMGGPYATLARDVVMADTNLDYVIAGEGDEPFVDFLRTVERGTSEQTAVKGLSYRKNGDVVHKTPHVSERSLDSLPIPARDLLWDVRKASHFEPGALRKMEGGIMVGRGCPHKCAFCSINELWFKKTRQRSVENVLREIAELKSTINPEKYYFFGETFLREREYITEFCEGLIAGDYNISWKCSARWDEVNYETLVLMRKAGCKCIHIGVESGADRILRAMNKGASVAAIRKTAQQFYDAGVNMGTYFLIGAPTETSGEMLASFDLLQELNQKMAIISVFTPYPGTKYYRMLDEAGRLEDIKLHPEMYSEHSPYSNFSDIPMERFVRARDAIIAYVDRVNGF